jgi:hypothetical protein
MVVQPSVTSYAVLSCAENVAAVGAPTLQVTVVGELHAAADSFETFAISEPADSEIDVGLSVGGERSIAGDFHVGNTSGGESSWSSRFGNGRRARQHAETSHRHRIWASGGQPACVLAATV